MISQSFPGHMEMDAVSSQQLTGRQLCSITWVGSRQGQSSRWVLLLCLLMVRTPHVVLVIKNPPANVGDTRDTV